MRINSSRFMAYTMFVYFLLTPLDFVTIIPGISLVRIIVLLPLLGLFLNFQNITFKMNKQLFLMLVFIFFLFSTLVYSIDFSATLSRIMSIIQNLFLIIIVSQIKFTKTDISVLIKGLFLGGVLTIVLLIAFMEPLGSSYRISIIIDGVYQDPNYLIGYLLFTSVFCFSKIIDHRKFIYFLIYIIIFVFVLLTGSRGGMVAFILSMISYILLLSRSMKIIIRNIVVVILLITVMYFISNILIPGELLSRYTIAYSINDSGAGRIMIWESALYNFANSPFVRQIFGWGPNTIRQFTIGNAVAHNLWIESLLEVGVLGFFVLLLIYYTFVKLSFKHDLFILFSVLLGLIFMTLTLSLYSYKPIWNVFLMILIIYRFNLSNKENQIRL